MYAILFITVTTTFLVSTSIKFAPAFHPHCLHPIDAFQISDCCLIMLDRSINYVCAYPCFLSPSLGFLDSNSKIIHYSLKNKNFY